ncbi:MAG: RDD family protein [Sandaracinus sp.]|nr:RDD family protein [Sandaracinus sp.]
MRERELHLGVVGPEGVALRFPAATLSERAMAFGVDLALLFLSLLVVGIVLLAAGAVSGLTSLIGLGLVAAFVIQHGYFAFFEIHWQGATPGKRLLKLRVVSRDGSGLRADAVLARNLMRDVELFLPLAGIAAPEQLVGDAPWWMLAPTSLWLAVMLFLPFVAKERTRVGDLVGGTFVVRIPEAELAHDEAARTSLVPGAPPSDAITFTHAQLDHYGEKELETLADLMRKHQSGHATDDDLRVVARAIAQKIGFGGPTPTQDAPRFLRSFYKQQRAYLEKKLLFGKRKASKFDD